jgi:hypothetical protein
MFWLQFLLFGLITSGVGLGVFWMLKKTLFEGKWEYGIYFLLPYLAVYITSLSIVFSATDSVVAVKVFQGIKDGMVFLAFGSFLIYQRDLWRYPFRLNAVDKTYMAFMGLALLYLFIPLGEAAFMNRLVYLKNMAIPALFYFLGRNTKFDPEHLKKLFLIIFGIAIAAFLINVFEKLVDTHFQTFTGYAAFNFAVNDVPPSGNFGLTWTFETQAVTKRLASFFSDPLELASSVLLGFSAGLIWYLTSSRKDGYLYILVMGCSFMSLLFSSSRAAFAAFLMMIFFIALVFKLTRLILFGMAIVMIFSIWVIYFASDDFYYFVIDTLTFQNESSIGHVLEWIIAWEGMVANPMGMGLAMSGNVGSVTDEVRVGGENQFLIYGVQLGFIGFLLYILLLGLSIYYGIWIYRKTPNVMTARVAFVGATVKAGMFLPLFTANAEMYGYVSWGTWWMIGYTMSNYATLKISHAEENRSR